jgi:hypothetical protein
MPSIEVPLTEDVTEEELREVLKPWKKVGRRIRVRIVGRAFAAITAHKDVITDLKARFL